MAWCIWHGAYTTIARWITHAASVIKIDDYGIAWRNTSIHQIIAFNKSCCLIVSDKSWFTLHKLDYFGMMTDLMISFLKDTTRKMKINTTYMEERVNKASYRRGDEKQKGYSISIIHVNVLLLQEGRQHDRYLYQESTRRSVVWFQPDNTASICHLLGNIQWNGKHKSAPKLSSIHDQMYHLPAHQQAPPSSQAYMIRCTIFQHINKLHYRSKERSYQHSIGLPSQCHRQATMVLYWTIHSRWYRQQIAWLQIYWVPSILWSMVIYRH